jgi:hypothetical protein
MVSSCLLRDAFMIHQLPQIRVAIWLQATLIFIVTAVLFLRSGVEQVGDSHFSMLLSQHILRHGNIYLDQYFTLPLDRDIYPEIARNGYPRHVRLINGHVYYRYPHATSFLSIPAVAAMKAVGVSPLLPDGRYNKAGERLIQKGLAGLLMAILAVIFFLTSRLVLPGLWSALMALGGALGTQVWSSASRAMWSHTWEIFLLGVVALLLVGHEQRRWRINPFLLATLLAWAYFVRPVGIVPLTTVGGYLFFCHRALFWRYSATCAGWLALFGFYSLNYFDQPLPGYFLPRSTPSGHRPETFLPSLAGLLLSPSRGLFVYVPIVLFIFYLLVKYRRLLPFPILVVLALLTATGQLATFFIAGKQNWWGGHSYGPRLLTDLVPWFVLLGVAGVKAMLDAHDSHGPSGNRLGWIAQLTAGAALLTFSVAINARGASSWDTSRWNTRPIDVAEDQTRLWDWSRPQFLAGLLPPDRPKR